ncbi:hypothetical protein P3M90_002449 [Salmonella enterica]|uniref:Uncharacterized protein n=2 Tax=Salmonella houtenae TaxID=59205 RepID=A0A2K0JHR9_SALHO|nr:hypothetical protein [Salmonella enterica subsp. houtenae]EAB2652641.1 hypothetical protein [Salmonella enterica]ECH8280242.1 hypothetical protein [Salmonella enterica subsp. enterica]EEH1859527.1 hypothetical protein [Salmonella enterica subsp. houtenae serovar 50:g,z51:-]ESE84678.1 hypothetical protein SEH50133_17624 [Salmonella enterica subsp. houtenae serovar 50:g,z51:- str. 01-0133]HAC6519285.1 hypothetical protein [Salmonella enterica subsp. houtenae serovar 45:g,z51:-]HAE7576514.1 h
MDSRYVVWTCVYHKKSEPIEFNSFYKQKTKPIFKYSSRGEAAFTCAERNSKLTGDYKYSPQKYYDIEAKNKDEQSENGYQQRELRKLLIKIGRC